MQEGISYIAGAELPCVVADIMRGGPGLGNIAPEQGDYHQVVKGGGHGNYRTLVLAPASVQEMADLTIAGLRPGRPLPQSGGGPGRWLHRPDDGAGGFADPIARRRAADWAVLGTAETRPNMISSIFLEPDKHGAPRPQTGSQVPAKPSATRCDAECWRTDDAEIVLVGYGIVGRILKAVVEQGRAARPASSACCGPSRCIRSPTSASAS